MEKVKKIFVISSDAAVAELTSGAKTLGEEVWLIYTGDKSAAVNANRAFYISCEQDSFVSYVPAIVDMVRAEKPELIMTDCSKNGRLIASYAAAACGTAVQSDVSEVLIANGHIQTKRMAYGGSAIQTEVSFGTAVICVSNGIFEVSAPDAVNNVETMPCKANDRICFISRKEKPGSKVNLGAAKMVVGVGRGLTEESDFERCNNFATQIGAEIGCSRPVSEEKHWLPSSCYIGVSGAMIKPELYFAIGISGQVQHMVGVSEAGTIIAIDKNESAPIFKSCDYGIVGDLRKIIPVLSNLLSK